LSESADIRKIVLSLMSGRPQKDGMCSHWTSRNQEALLSTRLGPWLYKSLKEPVRAGLDPDIFAALQQQYRASVVSCLFKESAMHKLLARFNESNIPVILLKGCYLGRFVYKDPALRPMDDIDVLVREDQFDLAGQELERLGYKPLFRLDQDEERLLKSSLVFGVMSPVPALVDLHRRIRSMDYYLFPAHILWEEAVASEFNGNRVFYLSADLNFIHIALHIFDHPASLRDWVDLATMVRSVDLDWDRLMLLARSLGAMRPLYWAVRELDRNWETKPPPGVSASLDSYVPFWLEDRVIRGRFRYLWRLGSRIGGFPGWRARLRYCAGKIAPPADNTGGSRIASYTAYWKSKISLIRQLWRRS
jgi:hypothetical protein